jgi:glycosyltransferase involved in cell wall biosynthesis
MKIAYIAPSQIPSATANSVQVMKVCQAFKQLGHDVTLYVPGTTPHPWEELAAQYGIQNPFEIRWLLAQRNLRKLDFTWESVRQAKQTGADLIYTRLLWAAEFAHLASLPVVLEMHEVPTGRIAPQLYRRLVHSQAKHLTVFITRALQSEIEKNLKVKHSENQVWIAPDGVDLERYDHLPSPAEARRQLGINEKLTAAYSGGFYAGRGLEILFDLAAAFPEVQFLWVGGNESIVTEWQARLTASKIDNVILTGFVANQQLPLYQACAEILLMPYKRKVAGSSGGDIGAVTSPMKLFEYMAAGRAILCSDLPVLHEVLNEQNAIFYPPEDLAALTHQFAALCQNANQRETLSAQARADVLQYSWKIRMQRILDSFLKRYPEVSH